MALTDKLTAIGDAIRTKTGGTELLSLDDMATAVSGIIGDGVKLPSEAYYLQTNVTDLFSNDKWKWYIDVLGNKIKSENMQTLSYMFSNSSYTEIPFEIFCKASENISCQSMFKDCIYLTSIPKISNCKIKDNNRMFYGCYRLRNLPSDIGEWFDWSTIENGTSSYDNDTSQKFENCYSLRYIPNNLHHNSSACSVARTCYYRAFMYCTSLDELVELPMITKTSGNLFTNSFDYCSRLKRLTFANPNTINWKGNTIDLSKYVGYIDNSSYILNYNSGIISDKQVTDDTTYQVLKDDPDWFTTDIAYSRYNHDSAVETINSLPDTSAYLASECGTNTIKFKGTSGSSTDGGAINTLTEEEIAVATAKGWTVTFV